MQPLLGWSLKLRILSCSMSFITPRVMGTGTLVRSLGAMNLSPMIPGLRNGRGRDAHAPKALRMLFHCDFYAFLTNLGDNDRAGLCGEGCCAVDGGDGAEGLAIDAIEADLLVVVETGDVDETTG